MIRKITSTPSQGSEARTTASANTWGTVLVLQEGHQLLEELLHQRKKKQILLFF